MEKSFFFNAVLTGGVPDRVYSADDIAERDSYLISNGVIGGKSLKVTGVSSGTVTLGQGAAIIDGYTYINTGYIHLPISAGNASYDRIDAVALKLDRTAREITAVVVKGTPAAVPAPPTLGSTATVKMLPLAEVYIPAGTAPVIDNSDITDRRVLAGYASVKEDLLVIIREYLGEIDPVDSAEMGQLRHIIGIVSDRNGGDTVLCGDGEYRALPITRREVAMEFEFPGDDTFIPEEFPSEGGIYDIEVQGAGGGGGAFGGLSRRGGGGGGGAYLTVSGITLPKAAYKITVGEGGRGVLGAGGTDGTASAFDGFIAEGGKGGKGGISSEGGEGGMGLFRGENGYDGAPIEGSEIYTYCGKGGYSKYGAGAFSVAGSSATDGIDGEYPGAGGSGASCNTGAADKKGGRGGDGKVTVYRYVTAGTEVSV